ncbi:MAG: hypothetical protein ED556_00310 [Winogradskyella sp.]|uniref:hypothetical protein n=1 Tax=Winogradskyella sp. TaxID=1883156 RepID=UPI000F3E3AAE|nr:hypothetical protein [Winogradskyella sp.]RNC87667.1 MAG: hypothetical protein ED556_00310 [Winogradskyella sp.]
MVRFLSFLSLIFISYFVQAQKTTLIQNVNFRAKELKHHLSEDLDSLILKGERTIYTVNIFSKDYDTSVTVYDKEVSIPLYDLGIGRYVVEVMLYDKRIIITLFRNESYVVPLPDEEQLLTIAEDNAEPNLNLEELEINNRATPKYFNNRSISDLLNYRRPKKEKVVVKKKKKVAKYNFWVINIVNSSQSSRVTRKMATLKEVERLIELNQLEIKTFKGQSNVLVIWQVYDSNKFLRQLNNDERYLKTDSPYFNKTPYYTTDSYGLALKSR